MIDVYFPVIRVLKKLSYCLLVYVLLDESNLVRDLALEIAQHRASSKLFGFANKRGS